MTDYEAFCLRAESFRGPLLKLINRSLAAAVRRRFDAEDVLQELLTQCPTNVAELLQFSDARFHSWLRTVAQRRLCDLQRAGTWTPNAGIHAGKSRTAPNQDTGNLLATLHAQQPAADKLLEAAEQAELLKRGIETLSADDQRLLQMHYLEELPAQEVAARLGLSMETCRKRNYRARMVLMILLLRLQA
ncbi:MAG UNVERIFIED_CONTAM: sigma-70 family RNA polymerase sigma factor [Planctomycetaceae bacterium]